MFLFHRNKGRILNQYFFFLSHVSILHRLSLQIHRHEVQGSHVHWFVFPQLLLWRCLLSGIPFQKLHLCGLILLQHRCVSERGPAIHSISGIWLAEGTCICRIYGTLFCWCLMPELLSSGIRHQKFWVWSFMALLSATNLQFDLSAPTQIVFPNSGACWQQWNWARLWNVFQETQSRKHQFSHLKSLWDVSGLCFHTCFCERRPRRWICEC